MAKAKKEDEVEQVGLKRELGLMSAISMIAAVMIGKFWLDNNICLRFRRNQALSYCYIEAFITIYVYLKCAANLIQFYMESLLLR